METYQEVLEELKNTLKRCSEMNFNDFKTSLVDYINENFNYEFDEFYIYNQEANNFYLNGSGSEGSIAADIELLEDGDYIYTSGIYSFGEGKDNKEYCELVFLKESNDFSIKDTDILANEFYFDGKDFYYGGHEEKNKVETREILNLYKNLLAAQNGDEEAQKIIDDLKNSLKLNEYYSDGKYLYQLVNDDSVPATKEINPEEKLEKYTVYKYSESDGWIELGKSTISLTATNWRTELYLNGAENYNLGTDYNYYYPELENE